MMPIDSQRITTAHLERRALIYVRQSSPDQVRNCTESRRVQLGLRDRAIAFGWNSPTVIEEDLGLSAAGYTDRPGFQKILALIAMRDVGIIFCIDASRLSRNSPDWANLFELCGYFDTLIADHDQIYDLSIPNDRLVLGIKGTVSELELSILRTRLRLGAESKAARGLLKFVLPPGYTHDPDGQIILDPDRRVHKAIQNLFDQFDRCSSIRQLSLWYRQNSTTFPLRKLSKPCTIAWQIPSITTLRHLLKHPIYAGAYVYGRSRRRVEYVEGKLVKRSEADLPPDQWRVCIHDHHPAFISWQRFLDNQDKIAAARPRWAMQDNIGPLREGLAMLSGLLRCGHCGSKLRVTYKSQPASAMYFCDGQIANKGGQRCLSCGSQLVDAEVGRLLCEALSPLAIDAARLAQQRCNQLRTQAAEQAHLAVQAAQYEADRAFEQFDLVDPKNRLVADSLEQRLNQKLTALQDAKQLLEQVQEAHTPLTEQQAQSLQKLGRDFPALWNHPDADPALKKRLLRAAICEIVVAHQPENQRLELVINWQGGVHTLLHVKKRRTPRGCKTDPELVDLVRSLASLDDAEIARILNMKGVTMPRSLRWTQDRVRNFRSSHRIRAVPSAEDEAYLTGKQVMALLCISRNGVLGLLRIGALHNHQITDFAPWRIQRSEVESETVANLVRYLKQTGRLPPKGGCPDGQLSLTLEN